MILKNAEQINIKLTNKSLKKLIKINNSSLIIIYSLITQFQKLKFPIIDAMISKFERKFEGMDLIRELIHENFWYLKT